MTIGKEQNLMTISAKDYVQAGLIAMWDGIENAGWGEHDSNATVWKDLSGNDHDLDILGRVLNDCVRNSNDTLAACYRRSFYKTRDFHIECVCSIRSFQAQQGYGIVVNVGQADSISGNDIGPILSLYKVGGFFEIQSSYKLATNIKSDNILNSKHSISANINSIFYDGAKSDLQVITNPWSNGNALSIGGRLTGWMSYGDFFCTRIYNRNLKTDEIMHNYIVDKVRFGI